MDPELVVRAQQGDQQAFEALPQSLTLEVGVVFALGEVFLRASGVCFDFAYIYTSAKEGRGSGTSGSGERWCTAPPQGEVQSLIYHKDSMTVYIYDDTLQPQREAPPQGWNCPTN